MAALLPCLSLFFDSGLSSPGLICCCTMSLRYVDLLFCGCAPTLCLATEFVAIFPVLRSPACSGCPGCCGFSSPIWFTTFTMGSPLRGRGWYGLDRNEGLVCFSFPSGLILRDGVTLWVETVFDLILDRDIDFSVSLLGWLRAFTMASPIRGRVGGGLPRPFAPVASFSVIITVLRDAVNLWVKCVGRFPLVHDRRLSFVLSPISFRLGFEPLSEASLRALSLPARFLVVLAEAASLRKFLALSSVLPYPMIRLHYHLHCTHYCFALDPSGWASSLCLRLLFAPCGCRRVFLVVLTAAASLRELGSLQDSSLSRVRPMSRVCFSVGGPVGVAHPFHPSLLLGGVLVRFCGGPCCCSLAMS